jgi:phosphoribosylformylglycinamidine cyclo-ligase
VRRIILAHDLDLKAPRPELNGASLGDALLEPTTIYAPAVLALKADAGVDVHAAAHITGGGIAGNVARALPAGLEARLDPAAWPEPPIFSFLQNTGGIAPEEMGKAFNLGLGLTILVSEVDAGSAVRALGERGLQAFTVGRVHRGDRGAVREERST